MAGNDIDDETLTEAAKEALQRPSDAAFWDERLYTTHGLTFGWADRGDDLLAESNYHVALSAIRDAAGEDADDHVIDGSVSHWLVGSMRQLFVQVRDDSGAFTAAWREAVACGLALQDYPILDESDYSERESNEYWRQYADALGDARNDYENVCYDENREADIPDDALHERVTEELEAQQWDSKRDFHNGYRYQDCDYQAVSGAYAEVIEAVRARTPRVSLVKEDAP